MHLKELAIEGYRTFGNEFQIEFSPGLNVLVGENGCGKSAVIDAIRELLLEDEFGRSSLTTTDFHRPFFVGAKASKEIRITATFDELKNHEPVAFLPWMISDNRASLNLHVENKETARGRYKRALWGGSSRASMFERELFDRIDCIYLPPLRDAEAKLQEGRGSRLARLLKTLNQDAIAKGAPPLEKEVAAFNASLAGDDTKAIAQANKLIRNALKDAIGEVFGQETSIQFSENSFTRIVESLRLFFFPRFQDKPAQELFRSLEENSLGYNNLLYLATVLAELSSATGDYLRILLIEEPEAHLHPQLQTRLLKHLEATAKKSGMQVILTTHSPVLAAAVSLQTVIHLPTAREPATQAVCLRQFELSPDSERFVSRWLDVTKSTLLFAKAVILVEGIAESLLLPQLARLALKIHNDACDAHNLTADVAKGGKLKSKLPESLDDAGVSVINMNGIYFRHFMPLFCSVDGKGTQRLPIRCAGVTDNDPPYETTDAAGVKTPVIPSPSQLVAGTNPDLKYAALVKASPNVRLFPNSLKTLEYDLAMEGSNLKLMLSVAAKLAADGEHPVISKKLTELAVPSWAPDTNWPPRGTAALYLLDHIDKGEFAQSLADELMKPEHAAAFAIPDYLTKAVVWACGGADV